MRYSLLVLDNMRSHPEAKTPEARKAMKPLRDRMPDIIEYLEALRPRLDRSYDEWVRVTTAERERERDLPGGRQRSSSSAHSRHAPRDSMSWNHTPQTTFLDATENQDLAVDLYKKEMHRRRRQAGLSAEEVTRRRAAGVWNNAVPSFRDMDDAELRRQMEDTRRQLERGGSRDNEYEDATPEPQPARYNYPSINKSSSLRYEPPTPAPSKYDTKPQPPRPPKETPDRTRPVPAKEALNRAWPVAPLVPSIPEKKPISHDRPPECSDFGEAIPPLPPKHAEGTVKQKRITFSAASRLENGKPLRSVFFPSTLRSKFLEIAAAHLRENVEMCGLLCGTVVNNALFITCLVIPEQRGTSDTCETENDAALVDFYSAEELITIGWIHTHPSQSCFMSSHDLHTHAGYQVSLAESFAIVCAPKHQPS